MQDRVSLPLKDPGLLRQAMLIAGSGHGIDEDLEIKYVALGGL